MGLRGSYMYGVALPPDAEGTHYHVGCCGSTVAGTDGFMAPNTGGRAKAVSEMTLAATGCDFWERRSARRPASSASTWRDQRVVFIGDEVQGPTFGQLHSLGGTRPATSSAGSTHRPGRAFNAEYLVPGRPDRLRRRQVQTMLTDCRDAMQYGLDGHSG